MYNVCLHLHECIGKAALLARHDLHFRMCEILFIVKFNSLDTFTCMRELTTLIDFVYAVLHVQEKFLYSRNVFSFVLFQLVCYACIAATGRTALFCLYVYVCVCVYD